VPQANRDRDLRQSMGRQAIVDTGRAIDIYEKQPAALRLAAANDLLDRYRRPPVAIDATSREMAITRIIHEVRWLPEDPNDHSKVIEPEAD
jgi:hypothetical protein